MVRQAHHERINPALSQNILLFVVSLMELLVKQLAI